jgi:hypothetical protein
LKINIKIDRLVLDGFHPEDINGISLSIEHELTRLFMENNSKNNFENYSVNQMDAGAFNFEAGQQKKSSSIGNEVARSVYRKLTN